MKKILVAMNNTNLIQKIKKTGKYNVHDYDITSKEDVIEYLNLNKVDVVITKDFLPGEMDKITYIRNLRKSNNKLKIILCVEKLDEEYKGKLFGNNIFDIIEGEKIDFLEILNIIDSKEHKIILNTNEIKNIQKEQTINIVSKKKICIFGTSGAGKSYVASVFAQLISKKYKMNTLLIDMDLQNAAIDLYNNLNNSGNNLQYVMEEIDRGSFDAQVLQDIISKEKGKNAKLSFITNNMGIYECQNKISKEYYSKLYNEVENKYDILLIDMPSSPFLDVVPYTLTKSDKIFFVINPNYISVRQAIKYLDLLTNIWKIDKDIISLVVNKIRKDSLTVSQIKSIFKEYEVACLIKDDDRLESVINGMDEIDINSIDSKQIATLLGFVEENKIGKNKLKQVLGVKNDN